MTGHVTGEGGHWSGHGIFTETKLNQNIQGVPKKIGINDLVWFDYDLVDSDCVIWSRANPGNSHPGLIEVWSGSGQTLCLQCRQIRAAWSHFTLPFQLGQGGWYWRAPTFSQEVMGKQGIYQRGAKH